jgi:hypothetical protein
LNNALRLFILLSEQTDLQEISLGNRTTTFEVYDSEIWKNSRLVFRQSGQGNYWDDQDEVEDCALPRNETLKTATGTFRQQMEDYVCHRGDLPFEFLRPLTDKIRDKDILSCGPEFLVQGRCSETMTVTMGFDDTFFHL